MVFDSRFTDAVSSAASFIQTQYEEARTGVRPNEPIDDNAGCNADSSDSGPGKSDCLLLGKVVIFHINDGNENFMNNQRSAMAPFIGFGAALNFYDGDWNKDDSDAGLEIFGGLDFKLSGAPLLMTIEGRYKFLDIADFDQSAFELSLGIGYMF